MTDKEFLQHITSYLTLNQYRTLAKIVYSFKKYTTVDEPKTAVYCDFKDIQNRFVASDIPKFFDDMASLAGKATKRFFETWYYDNVIFWPYDETPDMVKTRRRLINKCENQVTPYRFLYIFRENKDGEITYFVVVNKCFSGSPLWDRGLKEYIDSLWKTYNDYKQDDTEDYTREYNTKRILKHCLGLSNKQYKELVDKYPRKPNLNLSSYQASVYRYFVKVYNQLIDIPIDTLYLPYLYYKYVSDEHNINPEGSTFISDIIIGIAELKERGELK